jgi:two-component system, NtrC family, response regulator PilR
MAKRALIVDDEPDIRELLEITLGRMNVETRAASDIAAARQLLEHEPFDLCLTDMNLPDGNGIELVRHISSERSGLPVAVITAYGSVEAAIDALKSGAFDFLQKPVDLEALRKLVATALKLSSIEESSDTSTRLLGNAPVMQRHREQIAKLARSLAPIYISGESGSGKEIAARLIHEQGPRSDRPFVAVNCGAIPSELMESEFFGHRRGSFTGAVSDKEGLFQAARGGTLFLDEVADLPLAMQVKLLRAIQEKAIRPVGGHQEIAIDVRILSATHKDLASEVQVGRFRQDLYFRLNVIELAVPSLRERREDVPLLARHVLKRLAVEYGKAAPSISPAALDRLQAYAFPGNVRELENVLERAFTLCEQNRIEAPDLHLSGATVRHGTMALTEPAVDVAPPAVVASATVSTESEHQLASGQSLEDYLERIERQLITDALEGVRWNKTAAAKALGITFRALRYRLKKLGLD